MLEAVHAGCIPVVPDRLAYRENFVGRFRYPSSLDKPTLEAQAAARLIIELAAELRCGALAAPAVDAFGLDACRASYRSQFDSLLAAQDSQ